MHDPPRPRRRRPVGWVRAASIGLFWRGVSRLPPVGQGSVVFPAGPPRPCAHGVRLPPAPAPPLFFFCFSLSPRGAAGGFGAVCCWRCWRRGGAGGDGVGGGGAAAEPPPRAGCGLIGGRGGGGGGGGLRCRRAGRPIVPRCSSAWPLYSPPPPVVDRWLDALPVVVDCGRLWWTACCV